MKLIIRNDLGQEFVYECREFTGYDVFIEAREHWGYNWTTYMVLDGTEILESVLNPNTLDPLNAESIH